MLLVFQLKPVSNPESSSSAHVNELRNVNIMVSCEVNMQSAGIVQKMSQIEELYDCSAGSPKPRPPPQRGAIKVEWHQATTLLLSHTIDLFYFRMLLYGKDTRPMLIDVNSS